MLTGLLLVCIVLWCSVKNNTAGNYTKTAMTQKDKSCKVVVQIFYNFLERKTNNSKYRIVSLGSYFG